MRLVKPARSAAALRCAGAALVAAWSGVAIGAASCTVAALPVVFGVYSPASGSDSTSTGSVTVTCQPVLVSISQSYTLSLSSGGAGSYAPRKLASGAYTLRYQLYTDAARTTVWGDGSAGTTTISGSFALSVLVPVSASYVVYGQVPAAQTGVGAGSYTDTIVVTVVY